MHLCVNAVTAAGNGEEDCKNQTNPSNGELIANCFRSISRKLYHDIHVFYGNGHVTVDTPTNPTTSEITRKLEYAQCTRITVSKTALE